MAQSRAPRVSFVSLGCPKALVDSERIITRLRAEGYELTRGHAGADLAIVNTCGFLDSAQAESLAAIGAALSRERQGDRHRLHGRRARDDHRALSRGARRSPGRSNTKPCSRRCIRWRPRSTTRFSTWCRRRASSSPHATTLISRFQRVATTAARSASFRGCAATWSRGRLPTCWARPSAWWRPASRSSWSSRRTPPPTGSISDMRRAAGRDGQVPAKFIALARALGELGVWVRLHYVYPYPHVDEVIPADGGRQGPALSGRAVPACEP